MLPSRHKCLLIGRQSWLCVFRNGHKANAIFFSPPRPISSFRSVLPIIPEEQSQCNYKYHSAKEGRQNCSNIRCNSRLSIRALCCVFFPKVNCFLIIFKNLSCFFIVTNLFVTLSFKISLVEDLKIPLIVQKTTSQETESFIFPDKFFTLQPWSVAALCCRYISTA